MENQEVNSEASETEETATEAQPEVAQESDKKEEIDWKAKYYYLAAESENTRKREMKERENLIKFGNERLLQDLVEVVDNLERTIDMLKPDQDQKVKNIVFGVDMVKKQFADVLHKFGLKEVETVGKIFDPNFHEALTQIEDETKKSNEIVSCQQKGYVLNGRLTRAAKVVVAK